MSDDPAHSAGPGGGRPRARSRDDEPVLPTTTQDERELGWGDEATRRDEDWYRRERPPHHE